MTLKLRAFQHVVQRVVVPGIVLVVLLVVWEVLVRANTPDLSAFHVIPAPTEIWQALLRTRESLLNLHVPQTMLETLIGLALAVVLAVVLAALLDFSPSLKRAVYPLLVVSQTIPVIALAAVLIIAFGFGIWPKVIVVILFCFFPVAIATVDGLTATDPDLVALLKAMGATRWQIWRKVRFPATLPSFFSGVRIAATYSVTGATVGEFVASQYGLGTYLRSAINQSRNDQAFAAITITALLSIGLVVLVNVLERIALPWYFTEAREAQWNEPGIY
jgi:ABC-type nitrate/sulfonate/bicarbonate transport system permease component